MFRFRKFSYRPPTPCKIYDEVEVEKVDENGVATVEFVNKPNSDIEASLPAYSDYQLSSLLAANVPLQPVNSKILDSEPTSDQIEQAVSELERVDSGKQVTNE